MSLFGNIQDWIQEKLIRKFFDSFLRKVFAALAALIAAQTFPGAASLGEWIVSNSGDWISYLIMLVLGWVSVVGRIKDKINANNELKKKSKRK